MDTDLIRTVLVYALPVLFAMGLVIAGLASTWWMLPILRGLLRAIGTALPSLSTVMRAT